MDSETKTSTSGRTNFAGQHRGWARRATSRVGNLRSGSDDQGVTEEINDQGVTEEFDDQGLTEE